jgi:hypothetical protein
MAGRARDDGRDAASALVICTVRICVQGDVEQLGHLVPVGGEEAGLA